MNVRSALKFALAIALGAGYVWMQKWLLATHVQYFGNAVTELARVGSVAVTTVISVPLLFLANHFLFKLRTMTLGCVVGAVAFSYFYLIHPSTPDVAYHIALFFWILRDWPSLVNMLLLVGGPIAAALGSRVMPNNSFKPKPLRGSA